MRFHNFTILGLLYCVASDDAQKIDSTVPAELETDHTLSNVRKSIIYDSELKKNEDIQSEVHEDQSTESVEDSTTIMINADDTNTSDNKIVILVETTEPETFTQVPDVVSNDEISSDFEQATQNFEVLIESSTETTSADFLFDSEEETTENELTTTSIDKMKDDADVSDLEDEEEAETDVLFNLINNTTTVEDTTEFVDEKTELQNSTEDLDNSEEKTVISDESEQEELANVETSYDTIDSDQNLEEITSFANENSSQEQITSSTKLDKVDTERTESEVDRKERISKLIYNLFANEDVDPEIVIFVQNALIYDNIDELESNKKDLNTLYEQVQILRQPLYHQYIVADNYHHRSHRLQQTLATNEEQKTNATSSDLKEPLKKIKRGIDNLKLKTQEFFKKNKPQEAVTQIDQN